MDKIDLQRLHGRIIGRCTVCPGAVYTQDGQYFDVRGRKITTDKEDTHEKGNGERHGHEERSHVQIDDDGERQKIRHEIRHEEKNDEVIASVSEPDLTSKSVLESVLESDSISESEPMPLVNVDSDIAMTMSDKELDLMSDQGMQTLRDYASLFGIKGRSKGEIMKELKALRR